MSDHLARYVQPNLSEARVARQWADIDPRSLPTRPRRGVALAGMAAALCAAAALGVTVRGRVFHGQDAIEGTIIESGTVTLSDGSRVAVAAGGRLRVQNVRDDAVVLGLDVGSVDLSVPHAKRVLTVRTPSYDVVDVGTRFRVILDPQGDLRVDVVEGAVEVRSREGKTAARRVVAGESWSNAPPATASLAAGDPAPAPIASAVPSAPAVRDPAVVGPRELLETAERARLAGQARAEGAALDTLRRRFRSDPRAALAAFELGRVRLDSLGDAPGAVEALDDAIALAPHGPLREDAEARRVEALAAEHSPQCASARDVFLARHPQSAHAAVVAQRCPPE